MLSALARKVSKAAVLPFGLPGRRHDDLVILLYHRVGEGRGEIDLPPHVFERQIRHLAARQRVRFLGEALDDRSGGVVVTFDDGYRDFRERALPVLTEHGVPAVLYLATGLVAEEGGPKEEALSWAALREVVATGLVTIGSHTHSHSHLGDATEREAEEEMRRSKELIEDRLGVACEHFAYPFCVGSAPADRVARRLFSSAALDAWRRNGGGVLDRHRLGRTPVLRSDGMAFFKAKVGGLLDREAVLYRALRRGPWRPA